MNEQRVTHFRVTATVHARAQEVFAVLTDPTRHKDFDGSGMLRGAVTTELLTEVGQVFEMNMDALPRGQYITENHVRTLVPNREVSWMTGMGGRDPVGYWWGYEITPIDEHSCEVAFDYDWAVITSAKYLHLFPRISEADMHESLGHLQALFVR